MNNYLNTLSKRKKKTSLFLTALILLNFLWILPVWGDDGISNSIISEQLDTMNLDEIEQFVDEINKEGENYIPRIQLKEMILGLFKGNPLVNIQNLFKGLFYYFLKEVAQNFSLLGKIIVLAVFCAVLQNLHGAFQNETIGKLAYNICYMLIIILGIKSFHTAAALGVQAIDNMVTFIQSLLPTLMALLMAVGGITSSTVFQPVIFGAISVITTFIKVFIIPMVFFSAVLSIVSNISEGIKVTRLAGLIRQTCVILLGVSLTVFTGIISVQGVASSSLDSLTVKTGKFAVDNFVPIVGGFLKDAFETVVSCSLLIKNGVGIAGLMILLLICSFPLLKILSIMVIYKVSSALIQPILDNQLVQCLNDMSNSLLILLSCVIAVGVLFFIAITVIMGVGNMTVMMR